MLLPIPQGRDSFGTFCCFIKGHQARAQRQQVALIILTFLYKWEVSSALTCVYSRSRHVPFHSACLHRTCSVRMSSYTGSSAQKLEANMQRVSVRATAFREPGNPTQHLTALFLWWNKFYPSAGMWDYCLLCIKSSIKITKTMQHVYVCEYVHNNAVQNTNTAIFLRSSCQVIGSWIYPSQECIRHQRIFSECCTRWQINCGRTSPGPIVAGSPHSREENCQYLL